MNMELAQYEPLVYPDDPLTSEIAEVAKPAAYET
jgi:hypothetical protein